MNYRLLVVRTLLAVIVERLSLTRAIESFAGQLAPAHQAIYRQLVYGVLRQYPALLLILTQLLTKPLKNKHQDVALVAIVGLYELKSLRTPDHAVVNEAVNTVVALKKTWAKGLVNALLRRAIRELSAIEDQLQENPEFAFAHPRWLYDIIRNSWPEDYAEILISNNQQAPSTIRVNRLQIDRDRYLSILHDAHIDAAACKFAVDGINLTRSMDVRKLPGYEEGLFSVQDEASQLVPGLLDLKTSHRVLDACAAPGGKTGHMIESCPGLEVTALEKDSSRLSRLRDNLSRTRVSCQTICGDALSPREWWRGESFDRILLDAPCSATGIIRRKPDIKLLRRSTDIDKLAQQQCELMQSLWTLLGHGGIMLYTTCSILPEENDQVIEQFMSQHSDAQELSIKSPWGVDTIKGKQLLPVTDGHDGFYFARLHKQ